MFSRLMQLLRDAMNSEKVNTGKARGIGTYVAEVEDLYDRRLKKYPESDRNGSLRRTVDTFRSEVDPAAAARDYR